MPDDDENPFRRFGRLSRIAPCIAGRAPAQSLDSKVCAAGRWKREIARRANRCFNEEGVQRYVELRLLGDKLALEALELVNGEPGGYQFQVLGDAEPDRLALMGQMIARIRRRLAVRHLKTDPHLSGIHIANFLAREHVAWDREEDGRVPTLVIDGKDISWEDFGKLANISQARQ